jgi:hypothetical protein
MDARRHGALGSRSQDHSLTRRRASGIVAKMRHWTALAAIGSCLLSTPAFGADEPAAPAAANAEDDTFGHGKQIGLRAGIVGGYRMVFRYDDSPFCSEPDLTKQVKDQQKFCGHAAPLATEVALSFGLIDSLEPFLFGRFGLQSEEETNTDPVLIFGVGARIYTMSDSAFKIFIEPALATELEGGGDDPLWQLNDPDYKKDVLFHLAAGPHWDFHRSFGAYLDAGLTTGILRSIHTNLELQLGIQGRLE